MLRTVTCFVLLAGLAGCDVVSTTAATASGASAEVQDAKRAKQIEEQVRQQVQLDVSQSRARTDQVEKDAQ